MSATHHEEATVVYARLGAGNSAVASRGTARVPRAAAALARSSAVPDALFSSAQRPLVIDLTRDVPVEVPEVPDAHGTVAVADDELLLQRRG